MAYIIERNNRFYVVAYDGIDPLTGRERRRWHPRPVRRRRRSNRNRTQHRGAPTAGAIGVAVDVRQVRMTATAATDFANMIANHHREPSDSAAATA